MDLTSCLAPGEALVVTGSVNALRLDRRLDRDDLAPVQVFLDGDFQPVPSMQSWGEMGVSSLAWHPARPRHLFVSGGGDLRLVDTDAGTYRDLPVVDLVDVHEMDVIGDQLWIANTGRDEAVAVDPASGAEVRRIALRASAATDEEGPDRKVVQRYHANQIFAAGGRLHALVHHVTGRQVIQRVAEKLLKRQGEGGVLDLESGEYRGLHLSGPHSVRVVGDTLWVFDSGQARLRVYDAAWQPLWDAPTAGWGRGAALGAARGGHGGYLFAGSSPIRKRYLDVIPGAKEGPSTVEAFSIAGRRVAASAVVPNVEQINNLYVMDRAVAQRLVAIDELQLAGP